MRKYRDFATVNEAEAFRNKLKETPGTYGPHEQVTLVERSKASLMPHERDKPYQVSWVEWVD